MFMTCLELKKTPIFTKQSSHLVENNKFGGKKSEFLKFPKLPGLLACVRRFAISMSYNLF